MVSNDQHSSIDCSRAAAEPAAFIALLQLMDVLVDIARNEHSAASTPRDAHERSIGIGANPCRTTGTEGEVQSDVPAPHPRQYR